MGKKPVSLAPEDSINSLLGLHLALPRRQSREEGEPQLDGQSRPQEGQVGSHETADQVTGPSHRQVEGVNRGLWTRSQMDNPSSWSPRVLGRRGQAGSQTLP